jgi:hypothetical protein
MKAVNGIMGISGYVMDGFPGVGKPAPLRRYRRVKRDLPYRGDHGFLAREWWARRYAPRARHWDGSLVLGGLNPHKD